MLQQHARSRVHAASVSLVPYRTVQRSIAGTIPHALALLLHHSVSWQSFVQCSVHRAAGALRPAGVRSLYFSSACMPRAPDSYVRVAIRMHLCLYLEIVPNETARTYCKTVWCCVCCSVSTASVRVGCVLSLLAAWGLLVCSCSCVVGPRSWAGCPSWSVPFEVSCCRLRCYTFSHYCVSL